MKSWFKILIPIFFFNFATVDAQVGLKYNHDATAMTNTASFSTSMLNYNLFVLKIKPDSGFIELSPQNQNFKTFPKIYNYHNLAFFCKVEVKLEKATKFPVKFRLGDVDYVDQLEGK